MDNDRPALWLSLAGFVAVLVASTVVGFVGAPHDEMFSWELASIFGTALGTTGLAAATFWLANSTRTEVRATQQLAELTRQDQAARERPVVILENAGWSGSARNGEVRVKLRNVGLGPALALVVDAEYVGHDDWTPSISTEAVGSLSPDADALVRLLVRFPEPYRPEGPRDAFRVFGNYRDRSQQNAYDIITEW